MSRVHPRGRWGPVVVLMLAAQSLAGCAGAPPAAVPSTTSASATSRPSADSPSPSPRPTETVVGVRRIDLPELGGNLVVVGKTLWAATDAGAARVDPVTGAVSDVIPGVTIWHTTGSDCGRAGTTC